MTVYHVAWEPRAARMPTGERDLSGAAAALVSLGSEDQHHIPIGKSSSQLAMETHWTDAPKAMVAPGASVDLPASAGFMLQAPRIPGHPR